MPRRRRTHVKGRKGHSKRRHTGGFGIVSKWKTKIAGDIMSIKFPYRYTTELHNVGILNGNLPQQSDWMYMNSIKIPYPNKGPGYDQSESPILMNDMWNLFQCGEVMASKIKFRIVNLSAIPCEFVIIPGQANNMANWNSQSIYRYSPAMQENSRSKVIGPAGGPSSVVTLSCFHNVKEIFGNPITQMESLKVTKNNPYPSVSTYWNWGALCLDQSATLSSSVKLSLEIYLTQYVRFTRPIVNQIFDVTDVYYTGTASAWALGFGGTASGGTITETYSDSHLVPLEPPA